MLLEPTCGGCAQYQLPALNHRMIPFLSLQGRMFVGCLHKVNDYKPSLMDYGSLKLVVIQTVIQFDEIC